ncbi:ankyrin repeat domain-containing protein [Amorphus sp. MBR-141]
MTSNEPIAVFAYAFAHRKTQDFLFELATSGFRDVTVIGAPWKALPHADSNQYFPTMLRSAPVRKTLDVCHALGFAFYECEHDDVGAITALRDKAGFRLGVITGARIIKRAVIELFDEGILNIHPGKLPETAGLDLFFYTIMNNVPMGVTAHYIDPRVDAGDELFFEETPLGPDDTIEAVQNNNYQSQIRALRRFIKERNAGILTCQPVDRPRKNEPMTLQQKRAAVEAFPNWRVAQYRAQTGRALLAACRDGDAAKVEKLLATIPDLIEFRSSEGWTPLIVAAHGQHRDVVHTLLARGADANASGRKGTTVLMYAKSALMGQDTPDFTILEALLEAGADPMRYDALGKDVFHYLRAKGDAAVTAWLASKQAST